jgi:hypothetical protein
LYGIDVRFKAIRFPANPLGMAAATSRKRLSHRLVEMASRPNNAEPKIIAERKALTERHAQLMDELKEFDEETRR